MKEKRGDRETGHGALFRAGVALSLLLAATAAAARGPVSDLQSLNRRSWRIEGGSRALARTSDGYLWMATEAGLVRFDGVAFTTFNLDTNPELPTDVFATLLLDREGVLWLGTFGRGVVCFRDGRFTQPIPEKSPLRDTRVRALLEDRGGAIWIATNRGLFRYAGGAVRAFSPADGLPQASWYALAEDDAGTVWVGGEKSMLAAWKGDRFERFSLPAKPALGSVRALLCDPGGSLVLGTDQGVATCSFEGKVPRVTLDADLKAKTIRGLLLDRGGSLWAMSLGEGIHRRLRGEWQALGRNDGLTSDLTLCAYQVADGDLWVGTSEGLDHLWEPEILPTGLQDGSLPPVWCLLEDRESRLWVGTGRGIGRLEGDAVRLVPGLTEPGLQRAMAFLEDRKGRLWVTGLSDDVYLVENDRVTARLRAPARGLGSLVEDDEGTLWLGTTRGLASIAGGHVGPISALQGIAVHALVKDREGAIWAGTEKGLFRKVGPSWEPQGDAALRDAVLLSLHVDRKGAVWAGTLGKGLFRFSGGRVDHWGTAEGLPTRWFISFLADDDDDLWVNSTNGILYVRSHDLEAQAEGRTPRLPFRFFRFEAGPWRAEGMGSCQFCSYRMRDGRMAFCTSRGLVLLRPGELPPWPESPEACIERVFLDGAPVAARGRLVLEPGARRIEFRCAAPEFRVPEEIRFRFRMEGFDPGWEEAGAQRSAVYTNLSPGTYRFQVLAVRPGAEREGKPASMELEVRPFFYQTRLFLLLLGFAAIALGAAVNGLRVYRLRLRQRQLEEIVHERTAQLEVANRDLADANRQLQQLSGVDSLTGVPNRRRFEEAFQHEWRRAARASMPLGLLMIDIDHFKRFNDAFGHRAGDQCLVRVAGALSESVHRAGDCVARYGGEEFVVVLPEQDLEGARHVAQAMHRAVGALGIENPPEAGSRFVSVSIGVASTIPVEKDEPEALLEAADRALYRAKAAGRDRVCVDEGTSPDA